ncbi:hypothetical protein [Streptomyces sp. NPDC048002]|uniref:hypothetical protein n=1 Tax=unclassified Streptomyces TaxID=2593676 RepID=UPI0033D246C1
MDELSRFQMERVTGNEADLAHWLLRDAATGRELCGVRVTAAASADAGMVGDLAERFFARDLTLEFRQHPGIARTVGVVRKDTSVWLLHERPPGLPVVDLLRHGSLPVPEIAAIALAVLNILSDAHARGFVWGYLAAAQVWVQPDRSVVLSGSGTGDLIGLGWISQQARLLRFAPELSPLADPDPAADMWAVGHIIASLLAGRPQPLVRPGPAADVSCADLDRLLTGQARALAPLVHGLLRRETEIRLTEPIIRRALARLADGWPSWSHMPPVVPEDPQSGPTRSTHPWPLLPPQPPEYPPDVRHPVTRGRHRLPKRARAVIPGRPKS